MNTTPKKFAKMLKGTNAAKVVGIIMLIPALFLILTGAVLMADAANTEPVKYERGLPSDTYCYIDVQYMTEPYAELEEDGRIVSEYYYAADEEFDWVCVGMTASDYEKYGEIVDFTYDFEDDTAPETIRLTGTLHYMENDLLVLAEEYYDEFIAYDQTDVTSSLFIKEGENSNVSTALVPLVLGGMIAALGIFLMCVNKGRAKNAKETVAALKSDGTFDAVLAEYNAPGTLRVSAANTKGESALGEQFVVLASSGKVIRYSDIDSLSIRIEGNGMVRTKRTLFVKDDSGKASALVTEAISKAGQPDCQIDACVARIQQHNPSVQLV